MSSQWAFSPVFPAKWEVAPQTCSLISLKACSFKRAQWPRRQCSNYQRLPSTSEALSLCDTITHFTSTMSLRAPDTVTQGCQGSYHSTCQCCRSWFDHDLRQAVVEDTEVQQCVWATQAAECHPALMVAGPPWTTSAPSSATLTLRLGRHSLCSSPEAEVLCCFSCPIFSQGNQSLVACLWPSKYQGDGALAHSLWLSETPGICKVPAHKMLVTNYCMPITEMSWQTRVSVWAPAPTDPWSPYLFCSPFLPYLWCLIHDSGDEKVRRTERDFKTTNVPCKFLMAINSFYFYDDLLVCLQMYRLA